MSAFTLPEPFARRLNEEARRLRLHPEDHLAALLHPKIPPLRRRDLTQSFDYTSQSFDLPDELSERLRQKATKDGTLPENLIVKLLDRELVPEENLEAGVLEAGLERLLALVKRMPAVTVISASKPRAPIWWIKFSIDLGSTLAWAVVQHLGFVLNGGQLPVVFKPNSPAPYLNGGPSECLDWVIEATIPLLNAGVIADILEENLPEPLEDLDAWQSSE